MKNYRLLKFIIEYIILLILKTKLLINIFALYSC